MYIFFAVALNKILVLSLKFTILRYFPFLAEFLKTMKTEILVSNTISFFKFDQVEYQ